MVRTGTAGLIVGLLVAALPACRTAAAEGEFYLSPDGNDANPGTVEKPFATLEAARDAIRALKKNSTYPASGVTVWLHGGIYERDKTFSLTADDSGLPGAPVVYRACPNETAILIGGRKILNWQPHSGQILKADAAANGFKDYVFKELFFNGQRQHLARFPNYDPANPYGGGWVYVPGGKRVYPSEPAEAEAKRKTFAVRPQDVHEWAHPDEAEVFIFPGHHYWNNIVRVAAIDREKKQITLTGPASYAILPGDRFYFRNLFEELDAPGEWYLDPRTKTVYFWPPADIQSGPVYAPLLKTLINVKDTALVTFRGLTIECTEGNAVVFQNARRCTVAGCTIRNVGDGGGWQGSGVTVKGGFGVGVVGNDIYDVGSSAITLEGGDRKTLTPAGHYADNNYIHHTGVLFKEALGVLMSGVGCRASHNLIHDCPRIAIRVAYHSNDMTIEYNRIRHVNLETSDTGAIYTGGRDWTTPRGTAIRYNFITDSIGYGIENGRYIAPFYCWGIYLDDNSNGVDVIGNIAVRCVLGGFMSHNARDTIVENNIFVDGTSQQIQMSGWNANHRFLQGTVPAFKKSVEEFAPLPVWSRYRGFLRDPDPVTAVCMADNIIQRNIVSYTKPEAFLYRHGNLPLDRFTCDYNLIWHAGQPLRTGLRGVKDEDQWDEWKAKGFDTHSVVADPLFVDAAKDDYRLQPASPAFDLGFEPIPIDKIGPYQDELRATWPIVEAEGAREKPLISMTEPFPGFEAPPPPLPRNTTPVVARKAAQPILPDGDLAAGEWPEAQPFEAKQNSDRAPVPGPTPVARVAYDAQCLYVAVTVPIKDGGKLKTGNAWGQDDGAEVCLQDVSGAKPGPVFVVQGFTNGQSASVDHAGAPADAVAKLGGALRFGAKVADKEWRGEWAIPFEAIGVQPQPGLKFAFNLGVRRTAYDDWAIFVGALGATWHVENGGYLTLE
ncbi:MAG: hypothetical protein A3K19_24685 [Lentisphaerae bacterium RIFOXYB12_FULL_65_16]|nr:MAG: hypothetical protein A3K18_24100 [Lentisphaerae bacterium RIFOXYA12_64_32]OGV90668.1 MAG: hypothetical protein A3K19_24685 [Lentisphaerae bacterium RIFOXYB12_FULL_65_16]